MANQTDTSDNSGKIALLGALLGALIGGLGSFGATLYGDYSESVDEAHRSRQSAYLDATNAANQYLLALDNLTQDCATKNAESWTSDRAKVYSQAATLYSIVIKAGLLFDDEEYVVFSDLNKALDVGEPRHVDECIQEDLESEHKETLDTLLKLVSIGKENLKK